MAFKNVKLSTYILISTMNTPLMIYNREWKGKKAEKTENFTPFHYYLIFKTKN